MGNFSTFWGVQTSIFWVCKDHLCFGACLEGGFQRFWFESDSSLVCHGFLGLMSSSLES